MTDNRSNQLRPGKKDAKPSDPRAELELYKERITRLIAHHPQKAAIILTDWLKQAATSPQKRTG